MKQTKNAIIIMLLFILLVGCGAKLGNDKPIVEYTNDLYGYHFQFPEEWIGKVDIVEYDKHTEFVYTDVPDWTGWEGLIFYIVAYTHDDYNNRKRESGSYEERVVGKSDEYVFQYLWEIVGDQSNSSCEGIIENCEEKAKELQYLIFKLPDTLRNLFTLIEVSNIDSEPKTPSSESPNIKLKYPTHGHTMIPVDVPEDYPSQTAIANGDVVMMKDIFNLNHLIEYIDNVKKQQPGLIRIVIYSAEGDPIIEELQYDGERIHYTEDNTRDKFGQPLVRNKSCAGIDYETTETNEEGKPLHFGRSMVFYLTDCQDGEDKYIFQYFPLNELPDEFSSNQTQVNMKFEDSTYTVGKELKLVITNHGSSEVKFNEFYQLEVFTGYTWNQIQIPYVEGTIYEDISLQPGETHEHSVHFELLEEVLSEGRYRIYKEFEVLDDVQYVILAAEFVVD